MKKNNKFLAIIPLIFILFFLFAPFAKIQAGNFLDMNNQEGFGKDGKSGVANTYGESGEPVDIRYFTGNIIKAILGLLATIFLVLLIYAGFLWMTAAGNEDKVSQARSLITQSIIGLIIIMSAYAITLFVIELVTKGSDGFWIF